MDVLRGCLGYALTDTERLLKVILGVVDEAV